MFYSVVLILLALFNAAQSAGCSPSVNGDLSEPQPLLLLQNNAVDAIDAFPLPQDDKGTLSFKSGETINIACPGSTVMLDSFNTTNSVVEAMCIFGTIFIVQSLAISLDRIVCSKTTTNIARYTGNTCGTVYKEIEIGFEVNSRFIKHIITCFDDVLQNAIYSVAILTSTIAGSQVNYPRPSFKVGPFYNVKPDSVSNLYTQNKQRSTINQILGYADSNTSIIQPNSSYYLATGHYTPKVSFIYGAQQRLTFYYVNAAPNWQIFNQGNWNTLENNCRDLASSRKVNLTIYTGTHGISTLPDVNGNEQNLYIWKSDTGQLGIPVPALFYKVVYEPVSKAGIALIGINNPYLKNVTNLIICTDICDKVSWLTWKNKNLTLGYGYCCDVDDFRRTVNVLPTFSIYSLLL